MYKRGVLVLSLLGLLQCGSGQIIQNGQCNPDIPLLQNFNISDLIGTWYEYSTLDRSSSECSSYEFTTIGDSYAVRRDGVTQNFGEVRSGVIQNSASAALSIDWNDLSDPDNFWVLATSADNPNFRLIYNCQNESASQRRINVMLLQRSREQLPQADILAINATLSTEVGITVVDLRDVQHTERACFVLPVIQPGNPIVVPGQCNEDITVVANFNVTAFTGVWHEIASYYSENSMNQCSRAQYTLAGDVVNVFNSQVINQTLDTISGTARVISDDNSAKLEVVLNITGSAPAAQELYVVATDYNSYAISYSCFNVDNTTKRIFSWILSRDRQLSPEAQVAVDQVVASEVLLNTVYYQETNQTDAACFYYPEPVENQPVVFPGLCDRTIPVVTNFNATAYAGLWHDIESYPSLFQTGTCRNANYALSDVVDVRNTQVIDQRLDVSIGFAVPAGNGTDGKLLVTFPEEGVNDTVTDYWVLATDYESYALVYSCRDNVETEESQVWAWKLSRNKQLTPEASADIDEAMANIPTLSQQYFQPVNQSADGCFYFPEPQIGSPVIFPGQCDENINVVQNFNLSLFNGTWFEIEAYPKIQQQGQCIYHNYAIDTDTLSLQSWQVLNQTLGLSNATLRFNTTDNSAKMIIALSDSDIEIPFWILNIDYDDYALAYSCVNQNDDYRAIYSWKLSRTTELSVAASAAISANVASIDVLDQRYYEPIDHSDDACFFIPDLAPGEPVIFEGQCDPNIPVVENFNATRYLGRWRLIESYPSEFQNGSCNRATYTLNPDMSVDVYNTQVNNQTLYAENAIAFIVENGKLEVQFPNAPSPSNYWVLDTDYDSYALVYSCRNISSNRQQVWSWKLSRFTFLTPEAVSAINRAIDTVPVLVDRFYQEINHSEETCFYFPEPQPGVPVVFPGQCDVNITVVQNFNLSEFEGIWYEIEAYPKEQQQGQCINHGYTTGSGNTSLNLQSSWVSNSFVDINNAVLSFDSIDGSARMIITLNGTDIEIPFWILDISYDDYALAYSCVNQNDDYRAIYSWKLSRTTELSVTASAAFNATVASIDVLDQRYYEPIDHSDDACFFIPDLAPGEPVIFEGQCDPNIPVVENFNATGYLGRWRLIESYPSEFQNGSCNQATYTLNPDMSVDVYNTQVNNQTLYAENAIAFIVENGKLEVQFPNAPSPSNYWVLDTDYDSYALVYSCRNISSNRQQVWSWKLSRTNVLTPEAVVAINAKIDTVPVLNNRFYQEIEHSDEACFYFPEPNPTTPVRFRGRCDQNISTVADFNVTAYLGLWHNIELYPSVFQFGDCINAYYSEGPDGVIVYNTQVVNQTLDTMTGLAVVAFTDGSAKLNVTFPVAGTNFTVTTSYWVLDTDYVSYALVYTCEEFEEFGEQYKLVYSWKLSRNKQISDDEMAAINNTISGIPVLDQRYYTPTDQSSEGCFYFPEPQPGVPVVFPGQCDMNISVVQDFNLTQFDDIWYEIEAYPKEQQQGQCIYHDYTTGSGNTSLNLQSSWVSNSSLSINNGVLSFDSIDGSARMSITLNGTDITIPFWILSTNYEDYALAYSCVNQPNDHKSIYSWKLSRSKSLSNAAIIAINNVISSIEVLDQRYYEEIDQSANACFYLPELGPGEPVIFPGICDESIPAVPNFDAEKYLGAWRNVATYQSEFQGGSCAIANYSLAEDGSTVIVYNTQVFNDLTLDEIYGTAVVAPGETSGKLLVTFPNSPAPSNYWVLATDYDSYALVYSCRNLGDGRRQVWSWKLSRNRTLSDAANNAINAVIDDIDVLDNKYYEYVGQTAEDCFYYPEPNGGPVTFRGQCNESVPVVQNFNVTGYEGDWYDVERYPQVFQFGTCPTATYTLNGDVVDVYNTQVVNQELDSINGTAVSANNDTSGKLTVSFPVFGTDLITSTPYWVLDTDYSNYSLVYSCTNLDEDSYRVTSWKLSRTWELSNESSDAIALTMSTVKELRQVYYEKQSHSEDDCAYYPDNNGGPVILSGQCESDADINAIDTFNATLFSGTWYEFAHFPSELQIGGCVQNEYRYDQGVFSVSMSAVSMERLVTFTGPVTLENATRGIFKLNISDDNGNRREGKLYVLDTDFDNYALMYSCRNINPEQKQVYSWKLSKSPTGLSEEANANIDAIVNRERDLFDKYYEVTGQGSEDCFYYPVFDTTPSSIILPGLCDESIRGMDGFDSNAYLGRWYEIERYPQVGVIGRCNQATLTGANGAVEILETQVLNRTLLRQTGTAVLGSTDGTGQLTVTFVVDGETREANYYILATDYTSYSLLYNCQNLPDGRREVTSWKLSKSQLHINESAISEVVDRTQGLLEDYYVSTGQTPEDCFYVPEFNANQAPRFRARCSQISGGVANFSSSLYLNQWWHEIEAYPSEIAGGECVSTRYEQNGNQISFTDTRVFGVEGRLATGIVTVGDNGQIVKTFSDGSTEELWIMSTDYDSYSILISCEEIDDEYIRVWSTKHSKTRNLTQTSQDAMTAVIDGNDFLYQDFFLATSQSDNSCFYYPAVNGEQVILPGQCYNGISTQGNFEISQYTGTWYQTERYPYPQIAADSYCIGTRYTLNEETGTIDVINWENVDNAVNSNEGSAVVNEGTAVITVTVQTNSSGQLANTTNDLYILSTDYTTYSLVYTCRNVDQYHRSVVAIKLSRTRTMQASSSNAINQVMAQISELDQRYFISVEQNEDCRDPSSAFLYKSSIIITLVCLIIHGLV